MGLILDNYFSYEACILLIRENKIAIELPVPIAFDNYSTCQLFQSREFRYLVLLD